MPNDIEPGEYADAMPEMSDEEFAALKASIREHGFDDTKPITVDDDGTIIDGHHRYRACQAVGVEPEIVVVSDSTPDQAFRANLARRSLDAGQKRDVVERFLDEYYDGDRTQAEVASDLGVSQSTVSRAWKNIQLNNFPPEEKRQQVAAYLEENPDASNREVAEGVEADVSHATVGEWRQEMETADGAEREAGDTGGREPQQAHTDAQTSESNADAGAAGGVVAEADGAGAGVAQEAAENETPFQSANEGSIDTELAEQQAALAECEARVDELEEVLRDFISAVENQDPEAIHRIADRAREVM